MKNIENNCQLISNFPNMVQQKKIRKYFTENWNENDSDITKNTQIIKNEWKLKKIYNLLSNIYKHGSTKA